MTRLKMKWLAHGRITGMIGEIAIAAGGLGCAVAAGYHAMAPESQWYGRTVTRALSAEGARRMVLTYDDGPNEAWTPQLLEVLARHEVRATFFVIGRYVRQRPELVRAVVAAGHEVGNHTWDHPNLIFCGAAETRRQLRDCSAAIADATGKMPVLFRPPFGGRRPSTLRIARELGLTPVMWNVTGYDWSATTGAAIEEKVMRQVARHESAASLGGDLILLHDGGHKGMGADRGQSVDATERILRRYKVLGGREFVGVGDVVG